MSVVALFNTLKVNKASSRVLSSCSAACTADCEIAEGFGILEVLCLRLQSSSILSSTPGATARREAVAEACLAPVRLVLED